MSATKIIGRMPLVLALSLAACATQQTTGGGAGGGTGSDTGSATTAASAGGIPTPPYYSVQLASFKTENKARAVFAMAPGEPFTRAEKRGEWLGIRIGAWSARDEAEQALGRHKTNFDDAFVIRCLTQPPFIQP